MVGGCHGVWFWVVYDKPYARFGMELVIANSDIVVMQCPPVNKSDRRWKVLWQRVRHAEHSLIT